MENEKLIDQSSLAQTIADGLNTEFFDMFLVKPMDPIKVKKEFAKLPTSKTPSVDNNGIEAVDLDEACETEIKEVDSDYRKGVVLKIPVSYNNFQTQENSIRINIGDVIIYRATAGRHYDLFKDSMLVKYYDIVGIEK